MLGSLQHFRPQFSPDVVIIHGIAELAAHDDADNIFVDASADKQGAAVGAKRFESGAVTLQAKSDQQSLEVLSDRVVSPGLQQPLRVAGIPCRITLRTNGRAEQQRLCRVPSGRCAMLDAPSNRLDRLFGQYRHSRPSVLDARELDHAGIQIHDTFGQGGTIIGTKAGEQGQKDLSQHVRIVRGLDTLSRISLTTDPLGFRDDLSQLANAPSAVTMIRVPFVAFFIEPVLRRRIEVVHIVGGQHQLSLGGVIETGAHERNVSVRREHSPLHRLGFYAIEQRRCAAVCGVQGPEAGQRRGRGDGNGQVVFEFGSTLCKLDGAQITILIPALLAGQIQVDRVAEKESLLRCAVALAVDGVSVGCPAFHTAVRIGFVAHGHAHVFLEPVSALMPVQREAFGHDRLILGFSLGCGNGCGNLHITEVSLDYAWKSSRLSGMTNIPDKDEVGRSNRLGPIAENTGNTGDFPDSDTSQKNPEANAKQAIAHRTLTLSGVVEGVTGHLTKQSCRDIEGHAYRFPIKLFGPCVYFLIHKGEIVYIGQSRCPLDRFDSHRVKFAGLFDEILFRRVKPDNLLAIEQRLIRKHNPIINLMSADYYRAVLNGTSEKWIRDRMSPPPVMERRAKRAGVSLPKAKQFRLSAHPKADEADAAFDAPSPSPGGGR